MGETIEIKIDDIAFGGEGVGHHNGIAVFVPFVAVDEIVEIEDPLFGLNVGESDEDWLGEIAPPPELDPRQGLRHRMIGNIITPSRP